VASCGAKGNRSVWLEASYIPVSDRRGRVIRVIKIAADISERVHSALEQEAVVNAINRSMAIITFNPEGIVLEANENFVNATGYKRDEIIGKHHRLFCAETLYKSDEYRHFWESLNQGEFFLVFHALTVRETLCGSVQLITLSLTVMGSFIKL
jgi:methyl-accepting chemotaxis protein